MTIAVKRQQDCAICKELRGSQQTRISLALEDENVSNAVLVLSDLFAVIPSVGPLVRGHALVVTRRHSSNILASLDESGYSEFREVCRQYSDWSKNAGASDTRLLCFEHGSRCSTEQMLCSTGHGHVTFCPYRTMRVRVYWRRWLNKGSKSRISTNFVVWRNTSSSTLLLSRLVPSSKIFREWFETVRMSPRSICGES